MKNTTTVVQGRSQYPTGVHTCVLKGGSLRLAVTGYSRTQEMWGGVSMVSCSEIFVLGNSKTFYLVLVFCHLPPIVSIVLDWPKTKAGCFRIRFLL